MTLLLGPPGCGKSTFLLVLAGKLTDDTLKLEGDISYNGYKLNEFVPQKTAAYISQYVLHISEMTVRESLDFAAHCHGTGNRAEILTEVIRWEKRAGFMPEPDIDKKEHNERKIQESLTAEKFKEMHAMMAQMGQARGGGVDGNGGSR